MTLLQVVRDLNSFSEGDTIYAVEPWSPGSQAMVASEAGSGGLPRIAREAGMRYFLEVFIAVEFLEGWKATLKAKPTVEKSTARLIQYAFNDA